LEIIISKYKQLKIRVMIRYTRTQLELHMEKVITLTDLVAGQEYAIIDIITRTDENGHPDDLLRLLRDGLIFRLSLKDYMLFDVDMWRKVKMHGEDVEFPASFTIIDTYNSVVIESRYNN